MGPGRVRGRALTLLFVAALVAAGGIGARAYFDWTPVAITVRRDSMVLHGTQWVSDPFRLVSARGEPVHWIEPTFTLSDPAVLTVSRHGFSCRRDGQTDLNIGHDGLSARMHVTCRSERSVHGTSFLSLTVGGPGERVVLKARRETGEDDVIRPWTMRVRDTTIARLEGDVVVPVRAGHTGLLVDLGGLATRIPVMVTEVIARDTLELAPGEFRQWPLPAGRYDITVRNLAPGTRSFAELEMVAEGTRCVPSRDDRDKIHCLVTDTAALGLRNAHVTAARRSPRTAVTVLRTQ